MKEGILVRQCVNFFPFSFMLLSLSIRCHIFCTSITLKITQQQSHSQFHSFVSFHDRKTPLFDCITFADDSLCRNSGSREKQVASQTSNSILSSPSSLPIVLFCSLLCLSIRYILLEFLRLLLLIHEFKNTRALDSRSNDQFDPVTSRRRILCPSQTIY